MAGEGSDDGAPDVDTSSYEVGVGIGSGPPDGNSDDYGDESRP